MKDTDLAGMMTLKNQMTTEISCDIYRVVPENILRCLLARFATFRSQSSTDSFPQNLLRLGQTQQNGRCDFN